MRELIDCHIHTERCGHATGTVDDYVRAAVNRGLAGIAITEHLALPEELDPHRHLSMPACDLEDYLVEVDLAAQRYPDITIVTGIEADYLPGREPETLAAIQDAPAQVRWCTVRSWQRSLPRRSGRSTTLTTSPTGTPATSTPCGREYFDAVV